MFLTLRMVEMEVKGERGWFFTKWASSSAVNGF